MDQSLIQKFIKDLNVTQEAQDESAPVENDRNQEAAPDSE